MPDLHPLQNVSDNPGIFNAFWNINVLCHFGGISGIVESVVIIFLYLQLEKVYRIAETTDRIARIMLLVKHDLKVIAFFGKAGVESIKAQILPENRNIVESPSQKNGVFPTEGLKSCHSLLKRFAVLYVLAGDTRKFGNARRKNFILLQTACSLILFACFQIYSADLNNFKGQGGTELNGQRESGLKG